jgi:hypothetical protein
MFFFLLACTMPFAAFAQQYMTREGHVRFFSTTPIEDIEAENHQTTALLTSDGAFAFRVPVLGFRFEKALMEEHFNENYLESHTHPNGAFEGNIDGFTDALKDGQPHDVLAKGVLNIHGVEQQREIPSKVRWNGTGWDIESVFTVAPADHDINIPNVVRNKIAPTIEVTVEANLNPR